MPFNQKETAIVLVECQKQWTEKGLFNRLIKQQLESREVLKNTRQLVAVAREKGVTVIHAPLVVDPQQKQGWLAYLTFGRFFTRNSWQSEPISGLFAPGDPVAERRFYNLRAFDAFYRSDLEKILTAHGIKNVFICGFATDQCPVKTLRTALAKGFNPYLVCDCTATFNGFFQKKAERKYHLRVITSGEFLAALN